MHRRRGDRYPGPVSEDPELTHTCVTSLDALERSAASLPVEILAKYPKRLTGHKKDSN